VKLGLNPSLLRRWKQEALDDPQHCFSGSGKLKPADEERRRWLRQCGSWSWRMRS